jgi:hypothetical protein
MVLLSLILMFLDNAIQERAIDKLTAAKKRKSGAKLEC